MSLKDPVARKAYKKKYNAAHRARKKAYCEANKDRLKASWKAYYQKNKDRLKRDAARRYRENLGAYLMYAAKARAAKFGLDFNLTKEDVIIPDACPVFGTPFVIGDRDHTPSLDRRDATKGYVKGNVEVISFRANRLKNNATVEEWGKIYEYLKKIEAGWRP